MSLPTDYNDRKNLPVFDGTFGYFPDALIEVARVSAVGNRQHNPGEPLHWAREKSTDQVNTALRHVIDHRCFKKHIDEDGCWHLAKNAWRALAELQLAIEEENKKPWRDCPNVGCKIIGPHIHKIEGPVQARGC